MVKLIMMCGISGSGKSYLAKQLRGEVFSSDALRKEMWGDESEQKDPSIIFEELHKRIKIALNLEKDVIYDATNLSSKRRKAFLQSISKTGAWTEAIVVVAPLEDCIYRNAIRERSVPEYVIDKQLRQFQYPIKSEGWDSIKVYFSGYHSQNSLDQLKMSLKCMDHDNHHHSLSIMEHMKSARTLAKLDLNAPFLSELCLLHDIGKIYTKEFKNMKGEVTEEAHYYGHQNAGVYLYLSLIGRKAYASHLNISNESISELFFEPKPFLYELSEKERKIALTIQYHMEPFLRGDEGWEKFKTVLQDDEVAFFVDVVHKYDMLAH